MKVTVLVPTYNRPKDLANCLSALSKQVRAADQVLVVVRPDDAASRQVIDAFPTPEALHLQVVDVTAGGVVNALNAGLAATTGDVVCMTDDDAMPHPDWVQRIAACYEQDPALAGVGGKDWVHVRGVPIQSTEDVVGLLEPSGRVIGNHHLGHGAAREVDVLKGVNMTFRASLAKAIRFDTRLKGTGAQVHNELGMCLALRKQGKKLVFDPAIQVDHFPAERFDEDARTGPSRLAITNAAYNLLLLLIEYVGKQHKWRIVAWYLLVGTRDVPGLAQVIRLLLKGQFGVLPRWRATREGVLQAARDARV